MKEREKKKDANGICYKRDYKKEYKKASGWARKRASKITSKQASGRAKKAYLMDECLTEALLS